MLHGSEDANFAIPRAVACQDRHAILLAFKETKRCEWYEDHSRIEGSFTAFSPLHFRGSNCDFANEHHGMLTPYGRYAKYKKPIVEHSTSTSQLVCSYHQTYTVQYQHAACSVVLRKGQRRRSALNSVWESGAASPLMLPTRRYRSSQNPN